MEILIDGEADLVWADEGSSVEEILNQLAEWLRKNSRAILKVQLDGVEITDENRGEILTKKVDDFKIMEVFTLHPAELSVVTLKGIKNTLPSVRKSCKEISIKLHKGDIKNALQNLVITVDALKKGIDTVISNAKLLEINLEEIPIKGRDVMVRLNDLNRSLTSINTFVNSNDFVSLADALEYELPNLLEEFEEIVQKVIEKITQVVENN